MPRCDYNPSRLQLATARCTADATTTVGAGHYCPAHAVLRRAQFSDDVPPDSPSAGPTRGGGFANLCGRKHCFNRADMEVNGRWFCSPQCADAHANDERTSARYDEFNAAGRADEERLLEEMLRRAARAGPRSTYYHQATDAGYDAFREAAFGKRPPGAGRGSAKQLGNPTAWVDAAFASVPDRYHDKLFAALAKAFHPDTGGDDDTMRAILAHRKKTPR